MYRRKENELLRTDRSFKLEVSFLTQCGPRLEAVVKDNVLTLMASDTTPKSLSASVSEMLLFQKSAAYKFVRGEVKDMVKIVCEYLDKMTRGVSPCVAQVPLQNTFLHAAILRMQYFMRRGKLTSEGLLVTLTGKSALEDEFSEMSTRVDAKDEKITLRDLEVFHRFKWLLSKSQKESVASWVQHVLKKSVAGAGKLCDDDEGSSESSGESDPSEEEGAHDVPLKVVEAEVLEAEAHPSPVKEPVPELPPLQPPPEPPLVEVKPAAKAKDGGKAKKDAKPKPKPAAKAGLKALWGGKKA